MQVVSRDVLADEIQDAELRTAVQAAAFSAGVDIPSEIFDGDDMVHHPLTRKQTVRTVTPQYRAPEIYLSDGFYDQAVDVWSLGCILYDMVFCIRLNANQSRLMSDGTIKKHQPLHLRDKLFCQKKLFAGFRKTDPFTIFAFHSLLTSKQEHLTARNASVMQTFTRACFKCAVLQMAAWWTECAKTWT